MDRRIHDTYAKDSAATNKNALSDPYVKFFRWATDRLQGRDGIVCFVSNSSFVDQIAFDGMRKHLLQDFTQIFHLDLHGNVRKNPKLSGTTHNVFGIQVGVGITIAVRSSRHVDREVHYYRVPEDWRKEQKLALLREAAGIDGVGWRKMQPNEKYTWLTEGLHPEFDQFLPLWTEDIATPQALEAPAICRICSNGVKTNRDTWAYNFDRDALASSVMRFIETYNAEVDRWRRRGGNTTAIDAFVTNDDKAIKWSEALKLNLQRGTYGQYDESHIRAALYRPYCKQWLYFDRLLNERVYQLPQFFPTPASEGENQVIWIKVGSEWPMFALATSIIPDLLPQGGSQCFPFSTYAEDGSNRRENITDWALGQFQARYGPDVTKWDIFHYVYGLLHHPQYRARYAENLKRELPRIPLLPERAHFAACVHAGRDLMRLHLDYEQVREHPLQWIESRDVPISWRVEKMKLSPDKTSLRVNDWLTLAGIPAACADYRLGNRSALEWIIDQYQVSTDKRSGITSDPNRADDPEYIVRLVARVVTVSLETARLVRELAGAVDLLAAVGVKEEALVAPSQP